MKSVKERSFWVLLGLGIWIGLVLGISFMEAPLKFRAPGITTELGLGIGRLVFGALNKMELVLLVVVSVFSVKLLRGQGRGYPFVFGMLWIVMLLQSLYLLPVLDKRAELIIAGSTPPDSWHHWGYVILEGLKVPLLLSGFVMAYRRQSD
ncbi:MAG: hypothetical protein AAGI48_13975 [Verrucomicrobiota bacterium]